MSCYRNERMAGTAVSAGPLALRVGGVVCTTAPMCMRGFMRTVMVPSTGTYFAESRSSGSDIRDMDGEWLLCHMCVYTGEQ